MNPTIAQEINLFKGFLDQSTDLGILIGSHQNLDTVASALSLYLSLTQAGKKVQIISKKQPTVEVSNLIGVNKITEGFSSGNSGKLVVSLPYIRGEVEKVLFTEFPNSENPTNINFHLTAAEGKSITPFTNADVRLIWEGGSPSAIITIGAGTMDELMGVTDANNVKIVNIDNFSGNTRFGDVVIVDDSFSSLSEIIGKVLKDLSLPMDLDISQNILDGVLFATRNFTKQNTSPLAFEAASNAMYQGAQRKAEEPQSQRRDDQAPQRRADDQMPQRRNDDSQQQGRRDQGFQNAPRQQGQNQNRDSRGQSFDRASSNSADRQDKQNNQRQQPRVSDTDFPAMHMQGPRPSQTQNQNPIDNRRFNNPQRSNPAVAPQRSQQQFPQGRAVVDDIRNKLREEQRSRPVGQNPMNGTMPTPPMEDIEPEILDAQLVNEPTVAPIEDTVMPEEQSFDATLTDEIPDDWLMPKVFKSSKNNN